MELINKFVSNILNIIHSQIEQCDYFQGFQISHPISGETGGGITCKL